MRHLYKQLYLTIIASLLLVVLLGGMLWRFAPAQQGAELLGELVAPHLPPAEADAGAQQQALERIHRRFKVDMALFDPDRRPIAAVGRPLPGPRRETGGWTFGRGGPAWTIRLPDERWLVARAPGRPWHPVLGLIAFLGAIALAVAVCAYPLVRRLTRRLERLQAGVDQLGAGDLKARVKVEGRDEVARLANSFNRSAERIEDLVGSHRLLLANASHELRTPLSRIRLGVELIKDTADPAALHQRRTDLERDIGELDQLIDEILLSSRLDAVKGLDTYEDVDLLALAAEEGARYEHCTAAGAPVMVRGDRPLLRRMLRNLIENAERHGTPPVEVHVGREGAEAVVTVSDHGPGVAASERERSFSPFSRVAGRNAGTGLGLTLVRQIARQHLGDAAWAGTPERPSTIRVVLPALRAAAPSAGE